MPSRNFAALLILLATAVSVAVQTAPLRSQAESEASPGEPPDASWHSLLAEAVRRATSQNPRIREAEARIEAARHQVPQTTVLPDPEVELGLQDVPLGDLSLSRDDFTMQRVTGRQRLPGLGKRAAQRAMAQADVESASAARERAGVEIAADAADAFFQLAQSDRSLAILEESRRRLEDAAASATELYKVGKAAQSDVLQAGLEKTSLDEQMSSLRAERRMQAARLNALQGLPASAPVQPIGPVGWTKASEAEMPSAADLVRRAAERSPVVAEAQAQVRRARQELELARLERRPDWMLMGYYGRRQRFDDFVGVSASINLPWTHRRRLDERRAEKEAELAAANAGVEVVRNKLQGEIEAAYAELDKNLEQARLYRDSILPQAEINDRAAREAYVVGKIDFQTLLRAATQLDTYRREAAARASGIGRAVAALQKASGLPLIEGTPDSGDSHAEK